MLPVAKSELRAAGDGFGAGIAAGVMGAAGCDGEVAARAKHGCAAREQRIAVATSLRPRAGREDQVRAAGGVDGDASGKPPLLPEQAGRLRR